MTTAYRYILVGHRAKTTGSAAPAGAALFHTRTDQPIPIVTLVIPIVTLVSQALHGPFLNIAGIRCLDDPARDFEAMPGS